MKRYIKWVIDFTNKNTIQALLVAFFKGVLLTLAILTANNLLG